MKILICNDDGVYAPGIKILNEILSKDFDITVVAPLEERSTTGHTLTLDHPLRVVEIEKNVYGCSGYPADCALMGIAQIMNESKPDIVVSGINRGANLGQDIYYSGTVAAAREASFHNIKSIAVSSVVDFLNSKPTTDYYETAAEVVKMLINNGIHEDLCERSLLNVNVPNLPLKDIKGIKATSLGFRKYSEEILERSDFRDRQYYWIGGIYKGFVEDVDSDCHAVDQGYISVSPIKMIGSMDRPLSKWQENLDKLKI